MVLENKTKQEGLDDIIDGISGKEESFDRLSYAKITDSPKWKRYLAYSGLFIGGTIVGFFCGELINRMPHYFIELERSLSFVR